MLVALLAGVPAYRVHTVFCAECTNNFDYKSIGVYWSHNVSGMPGGVTRLLACSKEQLAAVMDKMQLKTTATDNDLLFKAFKVPEGLHPVGKDFFDYKAFVGSIDPMERF